MKRSCVQPPSPPKCGGQLEPKTATTAASAVSTFDDPLHQLVEEAIRRSIRDQKKLLHAELSDSKPLKKCPRAQSTQDAARAARTRQKAREIMSSVLSEVMATASAAAEVATSAPPSVSDQEEEDDDSIMDWDVVDADTIQIANDEVLARACELMGSALFESDAGPSDEDDAKPPTDPKEGGGVSSDDGGPNPEALYASQLRQLSEVGLLSRYGKSRCVEILERLNAANVGSGEMRQVSVEKVVEVLLRED